METQELIEKTIKDLLKFFEVGAKVKVEEKEEDTFTVAITGDDLSFLIGFHGNTLNALQVMLTNMVFKQTNKWIKILVDINEYKDKRVEKIQEMTRHFIDKARFFKKEVAMPPMTPWERRQVHVLASEYLDIETESVGEGSDRHIIIKIK
ncbi:hypothetical protein A3K42_00415 [candidate division WWE3 bacterium RBG_13_37_7]|uniref:R3H domain-containing protein n=1 Tax=candidate division WWE3 bacterium RBG_13_37_7 TaxID=1802609 RepID=A0A1F4U1W7_UNCKA|nr:MAG: hypothetical protein A3K42_00415 [candidate division WWE3 bacterium RBG_13_37_7]